jgi:hypothetical protein
LANCVELLRRQNRSTLKPHFFVPNRSGYLHQPRRIAAVDRVVAAVAEEVHVAGVETRWIDLKKPAQLRVIETVPVIVDTDLWNIFMPLANFD